MYYEIAEKGGIKMDDILLTQEELEKQRELFEYEMTQVILNLKGKYENFDRNHSPIKESQEFADEVLSRHLEFEPWSNSEPHIKVQDIPHLDNELEYTPLTDIELAAEVKADKRKIEAAKNTLHYTQHEKVEIVSIPCNVSSKKGTVEYVPHTAEITVPIFENAMNSELFARHEVKYTPIVDAKAETREYVLPQIESVVEFSPMDAIAIEEQVYSVPNMATSVTDIPNVGIEIKSISDASIPTVSAMYMPHTEIEIKPISDVSIPTVSAIYKPHTEIEIKPISEVNIPAVSIQYTALTDTVTELPVHSIPALEMMSVHLPLKVPAMEKIKEEIPSGVVESKFTPVETIEIKHLNSAIPKMDKRIEFEKVTNEAENLLKIESPKIGKVPDFKPVTVSSVTSFTGKIPVTKFDVTYVPKEVVRSKVRPIDTIPKEVIEIKDFYAIWESM